MVRVFEKAPCHSGHIMIAGEFSQAAPISQTIFFRIDRRLQMADPALTDQWKETVRENIRNGAELNVAFLLMNVLAATIACYGPVSYTHLTLPTN